MELWLPDSAKREQVESLLPVGNLELSDGRKLKAHESRNSAFTGWRAADGLTVLAESKVTARHGLLLHVVVGYKSRRPSWEDVRRVRALFFGERDCFVPFGTQDDLEACVIHLWSMPGSWST